MKLGEIPRFFWESGDKMKLPKELEKQIIAEVKQQLPDLPKDIDLSDEEFEVTGLCVTVKDRLFIEIEGNKE